MSTYLCYGDKPMVNKRGGGMNNDYLEEVMSNIKNILICVYCEGFRDGFKDARKSTCLHEDVRPVNINGKVEFYQCHDCGEIIKRLDNMI